MTVMDGFSRYASAYPIPNKEAVTVAGCYYRNTFRYTDYHNKSIVITDWNSSTSCGRN